MNVIDLLCVVYRVLSLIMRTRGKPFHHQRIDNQTSLIIMKLSQVQTHTLSKMLQKDTACHKVWLKKSTNKLYNNNNMNNNSQTWPRSSKKHMHSKWWWHSSNNKRWMVIWDRNNKMLMNMFRILLRKHLKCLEEIWKKRRSTVRKRKWTNDSFNYH